MTDNKSSTKQLEQKMISLTTNQLEQKIEKQKAITEKLNTCKDYATKRILRKQYWMLDKQIKALFSA